MLEDKVFKGNPEIAVCDFKECSDRGNYRRCYFNDLFVICPRYLTHKNYLKTVREIKRNREYNKWKNQKRNH